MQDHSDDCQVVHTGICTCTRGIGQPAAQLNRKMLVDEYQRGLEQGRKEGEEAAIAKFLAMQNRDTLVAPVTAPVAHVGKHAAQTIAAIEGRYDNDYSLAWTFYAWALVLAVGVGLIVATTAFLLQTEHWLLWAIGAGVASFMAFIIKGDYDARKQHDVHRA